MFRMAVALAGLIALIAPVYAEDAPGKPAMIVGDATMADDGTIIIHMRRTADGINVNGLFKYPIGDPGYSEVLAHIGGLKPGETKLVPAWDEDPNKK